MRKTISIVLYVATILTMLVGCTSSTPEASPADESTPTEAPAVQENTFTDSTGREVILPENVEKIAVTGPLAQMFVFALVPDMLVGAAIDWDDYAKPYIPEEYLELPILGQLYGGKGELNLESLLAAGPDVVIDIGESRDSTARDLDELTEQTGIPFVHIDASISTYDRAYTMLGELLEKTEEAKVLADYCSDTYNKIVGISDEVEKVDLLYIVGEEGLNVIAKDSYHSEMIDLLANNLAVVDEPVSRGTGNEVDMEQILAWNPDYIIFEAGSVYSAVSKSAVWQNLTAINDGNYCEAPRGPYNWMGFPPSVQRYLGLLWMAELLYPDSAGYDLFEEVQTYYELFYHRDLTREQFDALTANSLR